MKKTKIPKLMLKGISQESGTAFKRGIHTLDEVRESGIYLLVASDVSEDEGLPPAEYCDCKQCYLEALLEVSRNSTLNGKTDKEAIGQKLTITNSNDGSTNTYSRSWSVQHNKGKWSDWQMVATGDIELIKQNNDISEAFTNLSNEIKEEKEHISNFEIQIKDDVKNEKSRIDKITSVVNGSNTVRFARIEEEEATINTGAPSNVEEIVYYKPGNKFVAAESNGSYWDTWDGMGAYMNGGAIRKDKVYLCGGSAYTWNGSELSRLTKDVEAGLVNIADIIHLEGADAKGVYKTSKPLSCFRTYRIHLLQNKWDIPELEDPTNSIFEIYYKKHDGSFEILARCNNQTTPQAYYDATIPDYFPVDGGLTVYIRAKKGEKLTFVFEDVTDKIFDYNNAGSAVYTEEGLIGENILLTESCYSGGDSFENLAMTAEYRTGLVPVKKGDTFCITGKGGKEANLFRVYDTQNKQVTYADDNADWNNSIYQAHVDGNIKFCCSIYHPYRIIRLDKKYISELDNLDLLSSIRFGAGYIAWENGYHNPSEVNMCTSYIPTMGFDKVELVVNVVGTEDITTGLAFYDADRNYISGIKSPYYGGEGEFIRGYKTVEYDIPEGAASLRTTIYNEFKGKMVLKLKRSHVADIDDEFVKLAAAVQSNTEELARVNNEIVKHSTVRFARIEEEESTINTGISPDVKEIVYYKPGNKFVAADSDGNYWDTWDGMGAYMNGGAIRKDKVYLCGGSAYTWDGSELSRLTKDVEAGLVKSVEYTYSDLSWVAGYPYYSTGAIGSSTINKYCEIEVDGREYSVIESVVAKTLGGASPGIVFYDKNDTYITGHQYPNYGTCDTSVSATTEVRQYRIPRDARKVRIACRNDFADVFYCKLFNEVDSNYDSITRLNEVIKDKRENLLVGSPRLYISERVSDVYSSLNGKKTSELYAEWDSMAERFPEYISRGEDLGEVTKSGTTYALRQYTIGFNKKWLINHEPTKDEIVKDTAANFWKERDNARKILIPIGMHGEEKTACWGAMLAFKELLESNEEWAMFIKSNFVLKVIPSVNPSGFNDNERASSNGTVMNREESVDAPENIMLLNWVEQNKDAFILLDFHGTQGRYAYLPCWDGAPVYDIVKRASIQLSSSLYSNYKEFYNSIHEGYGETYAPFLIAKYSVERAYSNFVFRIWEDYGVPAFALETPANLMIPNSDGTVNTTLSGLIDQNDLRNCKIAKDLLINCIQIFGCVDSIRDYYVR